jgi:TrmH family RNA methyltransferase
MSVSSITSRDNPRYRELFGLAGDRRARRESGRTLIDGEHLLAEAWQAGLTPKRLIVAEHADATSNWRDRLPNVPVLVLPEALFKRLSPVATPTGLLAEIDIPKPDSAASVRYALLLEDIQDPGNLGALLRTAAASGIEAIYLSPGCAEAWSPKALRGGQGGHFSLQIHEGVDLAAVARTFPGPVHAAALGRQHTLYELDLRGPCAFAFGNEGAGLSATLLQETMPFTIPMPGKVESLNVAAAAAVCLFERVRQRGVVKETA